MKYLFCTFLFFLSFSFTFAQNLSTEYSCPNLTFLLNRLSTDSNTNGEVTQLQIFLKRNLNLNDQQLIPTGIYGRVTESYVKAFQKKYGISQTGQVGPITRAKIASICFGGNTTNPNSNIYYLPSRTSTTTNPNTNRITTPNRNTSTTTTPTVPTNRNSTTTTPTINPTTNPTQNSTITNPFSTSNTTCSLSVSRSTINQGENATVSWTSSNSLIATINEFGLVDFSGSKVVSPSVTTSYDGSFVGPTNIANCSKVITVIPGNVVTTPVNNGTTTISENYDTSCTYKGKKYSQGQIPENFNIYDAESPRCDGGVWAQGDRGTDICTVPYIREDIGKKPDFGCTLTDATTTLDIVPRVASNSQWTVTLKVPHIASWSPYFWIDPPPIRYAYVVDWGDGSENTNGYSIFTVPPNAVNFVFPIKHTYTKRGVYTISIVLSFQDEWHKATAKIFVQ